MHNTSTGTKPLRSILLASASAFALVATICGAAQAQTVTPAVTAPPLPHTTSKGLEEITVTARRRTENLQKVPVAITALGAAQLAARSVVNEQDLQSSVSGLVVRASEQQNQLNYAIRGQSIDAFSGSSPGVLSYFNDVQVSGVTATTFYDLANVQVLKGPQGTLFGRNTTGGAVLFSTVQPANKIEGYVTGRLGDYGLREIQGAVSIPIVPDKVSLRVATDFRYRDGYVRNLFDGRTLGNEDDRSGRATLVIQPTPDLKNTTVVQYSRYGGTALVGELYSAYGCKQTNHGIPLNTVYACLYTPALGPIWDAFIHANPKVFAGGLQAFVAEQKRLGPYQASMDETGRDYTHSLIVTNTGTYNVTPDLLVKNIFGYTHTVALNGGKLDGTPYNILGDGPTATTSEGNLFNTLQLSDEAQVLGKAMDGNLRYIAGAYYSFNQERDRYPLSSLTDIGPYLKPILGVNPAAVFAYDYVDRDRSEAVFAQTNYDLGPLTGIHGLGITTGVRYTWEQLALTQGPRSVYGDAPQERTSERNPSWNVTLDWQATHDLLLYVAQRGSWRTGNFNGTSLPKNTSAANFGNLFQAETTEDVEVGAKYQGSLYDRPFRINADGFNQWVHNVQRDIYLDLNGAPAGFTTNVPASEITGFELDGEIRPTDWLDLGMSGAYTYVRFTSNHVELFGNSENFGPYADTPRFSGSLYAQVDLPVPERVGEMSARADLYGQSAMFISNLDATSNPGSKLPGYGLLNLRFDWKNIASTSLSAAVYLKNALDKQYYVGGMPLGGALGLNTAIPGEPRMFGFELTYRFGGE